MKTKVKSTNREHDSVGFVEPVFVYGRLLISFIALLVFVLASADSLVAQAPSNRFDDLEDHINGTDTMTVAQLRSWATNFASEAGSLRNRFGDFLAAVDVVELYEDEIGPLFTSSGQSSFMNSWNGETNLGRALGRAMLGVYQAVFDAYDTDFVSQRALFLAGTKFGSANNFPGSVPNPTDLSSVYEVQIDGTLHEEFGSPGGYDTNAARRMTGAYMAPGWVVEVTVPNDLVNAGFQIRVGGHSWDLSNKNNANRLHRVSNIFDITSNATLVANPMGGNIYIEVPVGADAGIVNVQFRNTIRAPFFSNRGFDNTTQAEWENVERLHPGAFCDIESEHSLWTVPSKWVDDLGYDQLMEIIEDHDANIKVASEYVGKNSDRHKAILYTIVDTQIRANVFSIGYPQSNYGSFTQNSIRAPLTVAHALDGILWHEHGHAETVTMFSGETESWNHMLAVAIGMENYGMTAQEAFAQSLAFGSQNHTTSDALNSWVVMDEFINNNGMAFQQGSFRPRGHADYVEYVEMFGLEAMQNFNRRINIEMDGLDWETDWPNGRTNHNVNDRILRLSREAGVNVAPLFHLWGHRPFNTAAIAAEGLGESVQIYDRMVEARDSVPMSQAQWNAVDNVMRDFLNESRGPWQELRTNYDLDRAQAAVDQIQTLIDLYFPNGRPADIVPPTGVPIAATLMAFSEKDFQGTSWELSEGIHLNVDLDAGPIGDDNISSILIPAGYQVTVVQFSDGTGTRATYTDSIADLGALENDVSRVEVTFTLDDQEVIGESSLVSLDHNWKTITLMRTYEDPVVIAGPPSYNGPEPSTVQVRNVTSNSFEIQINEWDYINPPTHARELVSYMVLEAGQHTLADGTTVLAGNREGQTHEVQTYDLGAAFNGLDTAPLVFANVVTQNDPKSVTTRVRVNSTSEFEILLQEQESTAGVHLPETMSYFAVEPGAGATGGLHFDAGNFLAGHEGQFFTFDTRVNLNPGSSFFAAMQTYNGPDTAVLRYRSVLAAGASVFVEEEKSADNEFAHADETIAFFVVNSGLIMGNSSVDDSLLGDVDLDGDVDFLDIQAFIAVLMSGDYQIEADVDQSGVVDFSDIPVFIDILIAQ